MKAWRFDSPDPDTTHALAAELGRSIAEEGLAIALTGPLGAGKTVFVKGLAAGLGVDSRLVSSPTFVIAQQYPVHAAGRAGPELLHHVDLYRLESDLELETIGFYDLFQPGAVVAVEWADRFPGVLGADRLEVAFDGPALEAGVGALAESGGARLGRSVRVEAHGVVAEAVLADWCERADRASRLTPASAGEGIGRGPQRPAVWILLLALLLAGIARMEVGALDPVCTHPRSIESDAWGTRSVACDPVAVRGPEPDGLGGLLFGIPLALDSASALQLEALPGIGPSRAQAIVVARGVAPFEEIRDLERVPGIGRKIRERVSVWLDAASPQTDTVPVERLPAVRVRMGDVDRG